MNEAKMTHIVKAKKYPKKCWTRNILKSVVLYPGVFQCVFPLPLWI